MALKVYDFSCENGHTFEAWLASPDDEALSCPVCGSTKLERRPAASRIGRVEGTVRTDVDQDLAKRRALEAKALTAMRRAVAEAEDVGRRFPEEVRKMALNETKHRLVKGECSAEEALSLLEDGIPVAPVPDFLKSNN
ncbi:MAG: DUF1178 family protein [Sutterella sp.]|nr:DUF1178 family protein [Sutterella sp.]